VQDNKVKRLSELPLFGRTPRHCLRELAALADEVTVSRGTRLVAPGERTSDFFVIEEGRAVRQVDGRERLEMGAGDVFGELPVEHRHAANRDETVVAKTDLRMLVVRRQAFPVLRELFPELSGSLSEAVALHSGF
jgi:CRP-like cAMP-binding protein